MSDRVTDAALLAGCDVGLQDNVSLADVEIRSARRRSPTTLEEFDVPLTRPPASNRPLEHMFAAIFIWLCPERSRMSTTPDSSGTACTAWDNSRCRGTPYCPPRCPRFEGKDGTTYVARPFRDDERSALVEMYADLDRFSRANGLPPATVPQIESWLDRLLTNGWNLVVVDGSRVVGHVAAVPAESEAPEFVIFVHQDHQNNSVGTELVKQLIAYADDRDHEGLTLEVATGNERAITVYENVGFEVAEKKLSEIEMELDIDRSLADRLQRPPAERE